jgi:MFS family permease
MFSMNPQIVAFLIEQGFEPFTAASIFGATGLTGTVGLVAFGWLTDNRGRFFAMTLSYVLTFTGLCFLMAVLIVPTIWLVGGFVLIFGPTFGSRAPILNTMVPAILGRGPRLGLTMGLVQLGMGLGAAFGATLGGYLRDVSGYGAVIGVAMAAIFGAFALYLSVGPVRRA